MNTNPTIPTCPNCGAHDVELLGGRIVWQCNGSCSGETFMNPDYIFDTNRAEQDADGDLAARLDDGVYDESRDGSGS